MMSDMTESAPAIRTVGVPREVKTAEHRVAMTPDGVRELERFGVEVLVETGAGEGASITDADYIAAGADIVPTAADAWAQVEDWLAADPVWTPAPGSQRQVLASRRGSTRMAGTTSLRRSTRTGRRSSQAR